MFGFYHHCGDGEKLRWWQYVWWCWMCLVFTCPLPLEWLEGTSPDSSHPGRDPEIKNMRMKKREGPWGCRFQILIISRRWICSEIGDDDEDECGWEQVWRWGWGWCLRALGSWGCVGVPVAIRRVVAIGQGALKQETLKDKINWGVRIYTQKVHDNQTTNNIGAYETDKCKKTSKNDLRTWLCLIKLLMVTFNTGKIYHILSGT